MLRLLANENVPGPVVRALRERGHDVMWIRESARGASDPVVIALAQQDHRILVTFDKDFGELSFRSRLPAGCGIILFRLTGSSPETDNARVVGVLEADTAWTGHFSVVTDDRVRVRPLPATPDVDGA